MKDFEKFFHKAQKHIRKIQLASWNNNRNKSQNLKKKKLWPTAAKIDSHYWVFWAIREVPKVKMLPLEYATVSRSKVARFKKLKAKPVRNNGPFGQAKPKQHE